MCTATWFRTTSGFELYFNRDERRTRLPARPPEPAEAEGTRYLAPVDADAGGTWLAVNEHGLALGLLNAWQAEVPEPAGGFVSRGLLVRALAPAAEGSEVRRRLEACDLARHQGFTLLVLEPGTDAVVFAWNGRALERRTGVVPLCSSSRDGARAHEERARTLERMLREGRGDLDRALLEAFHRSQDPAPGPWAVCMRREDAATVSASHVEVTADEVRFRYAPGPPDVTPFEGPLRLARAALLPRPPA